MQILFRSLSFPEAEIMGKSYLVAIVHCMFVGERINTYYSDFCPFLIVPGQILFSKKKYSYYRSVFEKEFETVLAFKDWTKIEIYLQHQVRNQTIPIIFQCWFKKNEAKIDIFSRWISHSIWVRKKWMFWMTKSFASTCMWNLARNIFASKWKFAKCIRKRLRWDL